ncbi:right-handed parallel beta-helix repeat-containing protein [Methanosarcina sp. T3]|uniref:right-handed parallel beta-helix repeat-containing protein n=1 Tax=Methanosarcina sp. T3 TaxID=3439062 RepID=UPI003F83B53E
MELTIGQDESKKGTGGYFYYNPENYDANAVLQQAYAKAAETATVSNPVTINVESGRYWIKDHVSPKSYVYLQGEANVVFKLAPDLKCACMYGKDHMCNPKEPYAHWGYHRATGHEQSAMFNIWEVEDVTISNCTIDGSYDDLYDGKMCNGDGKIVSGGEARGKSEFTQLNIYKSSNIKIDHVVFTRGANDGIGCYECDGVEVSCCTFNMVGHDGMQNYKSPNIRFHHNYVAMRTNCGIRFDTGSHCGEVYCNEFTTGSGGASAIELQNDAENILIHHNYFHDIKGLYGAIGYPGQEPNGKGHKYYNNLIINCNFGVKCTPPTSVSSNNIILDCITAVNSGSSINNLTTSPATDKYGVKGKVNTYWVVKDGVLKDQIIGIGPKMTVA